MKVVIGSIAGILLLMAPTLSFATVWNIDPAHSSVEFKVRHLMVSNVKGVFGKVSGTVDIDDLDITRSKSKIAIETASIDTGHAKRDAHLRSPDFLDVGKYPTMTFVSTGVARAGEGRLKVTGELTLRGVTRSVVLDVEGPSRVVKDPTGAERRGASAQTTINRKDFGLTWNKAMEAGGVVVGDEVRIGIEVEMVKSGK